MDDSALNLELEQQLEQEDELLLLLSTPRQRLEDARAMADGVASTDTEKKRGSFEGTGERETDYCMADPDPSSQSEGVYGEEQEAKHLLQRLSGALADNGDWKRFHDISRESQDTLAEINATLGSLRQWQKEREHHTVSSRLRETSTAANMSRLHAADYATMTTTQSSDSAEEVGSACCQEQRCLSSNGTTDKEGTLLALWKERHQTAVISAERLREKLDPASSGPCDQPTATDGIHIPLTHEAALDALVRVARGEASDAANGQDYAADLRRDADSLRMKQWIDNVRAEACDRAEGTAREACEDIWRETAPVGTMEGELSCFAKDLDSLLLRLDRAEDEEAEEEGEEEEEEEEEDGPEDGRVPLNPRGGVRAPAADAHVECAQ